MSLDDFATTTTANRLRLYTDPRPSSVLNPDEMYHICVRAAEIFKRKRALSLTIGNIILLQNI